MLSILFFHYLGYFKEKLSLIKYLVVLWYSVYSKGMLCWYFPLLFTCFQNNELVSKVNNDFFIIPLWTSGCWHSWCVSIHFSYYFSLLLKFLLFWLVGGTWSWLLSPFSTTLIGLIGCVDIWESSILGRRSNRCKDSEAGTEGAKRGKQ